MKLLVILSMMAPVCFAQDYNQILDKGINYIINEQVQVGNYPLKLKGEWPSYMMNDHDVQFLGPRGKKTWDSNCFTTASIYNSLAVIYKKRPYYNEIPYVLEQAMNNIMLYERDGAFGFWLLLPRKDSLSSINSIKGDSTVRRPNNYILDNRFINNASNVPEDADDTAVSYLAIKRGGSPV